MLNLFFYYLVSYMTLITHLTNGKNNIYANTEVLYCSFKKGSIVTKIDIESFFTKTKNLDTYNTMHLDLCDIKYFTKRSHITFLNKMASLAIPIGIQVNSYPIEVSFNWAIHKLTPNFPVKIFTNSIELNLWLRKTKTFR